MIRQLTFGILSLFTCTDAATATDSAYLPYPSDTKVLLSKPGTSIGEVRKDRDGKDILILIIRDSSLKYSCETHVIAYKLPSDPAKSSRYPIRCQALIREAPSAQF